MTVQPSPVRYSTLSKWLHWGSVLLVAGLVGAGLFMTSLEDGNAQKLMMYRTHGVIGLLIVLVTLARMVIRWREPKPLPEGMTAAWNIWLYRLTHWGIYLVLLALGFSGMGTLTLNGVTSFNVDPATLDRSVPTIQGHFLFSRLVIALVVLHVGGVLRHQFTKSKVLSRMGLNL
jgi:cytochrome b561